MSILLIGIILLSCFFSFFEEKLGNNKMIVYILFAIVLIAFAGLRPIGMDKDAENYEYAFNAIDDTVIELLYEPSFRLIATFSSRFSNDVHSLFLIYALLGVSIKFIAIKKYTPCLFTAMFIYLSNYYMLQELTQIRVGVAAGIFLFAIEPIAERKYVKSVCLMLLAVFFHYSSLLMLIPLLFLSNNEMSGKTRMLWAAIVPFSFFLLAMQIDIFRLNIPLIGGKIEYYTTGKDSQDPVTIANKLYWAQSAIYLFLLYFHNTIKDYNRYFPIMIKIMGVSLVVFALFASSPIMAFRTNEFYGVVSIILYSNIIYTMKPFWFAKVFLTIVVLTIFSILLFNNKLLDLSY